MAGPIRSNQVAGSSRQQPEYKVQPPRPPNAWILYRSDRLRDLPPSKERRAQADVSRIISEMWKNETAENKLKYERMADEKKAEHQRMYPSYRFQPMKKGDKDRLREERKQEREQARQAKKSKGRGATTTPATTPAPMMPPLAYAPPPYLMPLGYPPHMAMPHPYMMPYPPEARFGPAGPSPPLSAASSPNPSVSPEPQPYPAENATPSSSSSLRPSPSPESQISSSSSQPSPANMLYPPQASSLPGSQLPSPNPYAPEALPSLLLQPSGLAQWTLPPAEIQLPSAQNTNVPATQSEWNDTSAQLPTLDSQNPEQFLSFDIPFDQAQSFAEFQQGVPPSGLTFDGLQGFLSVTGENGVFSLSNINPSDLLAHPQGELEVAVGPQATAYDYNGDLFSNFDLSAFEQPVESTPASGSDVDPLASTFVAEELASLIQAPNNPEIQAYTAAQQRQPSIFTQDVMQYLNFEAAEGPVQDDSIPPTPTVAPQQVRPLPAEHGPAMPIFTQMTNTPVSPTGTTTPYAPPAGANYFSTRRVGGSWKLTFVPDSHSEEPFPSWNIPTS